MAGDGCGVEGEGGGGFVMGVGSGGFGGVEEVEGGGEVGERVTEEG